MANLLDNALKHRPADGYLMLVLQHPGEQVQVSVADAAAAFLRLSCRIFSTANIRRSKAAAAWRRPPAKNAEAWA